MIPPDALSPAAQAVLGSVGTGIVGILIFLWRAYAAWKKDRREEEKHAAERELQRQGRLQSGFAVLDTARDKEIQRLIDALEAADRRYYEAKKRWAEDLEQERVAHQRTRADRDRGWNQGRGMEAFAHEQRHLANNLVHRAHVAGQRGLDCPADLPDVPPLQRVDPKLPD